MSCVKLGRIAISQSFTEKICKVSQRDTKAKSVIAWFLLCAFFNFAFLLLTSHSQL